jgi:hypothetical protein
LENQANMFTVNTLRQSVNDRRAPFAQKLGSDSGAEDGKSFAWAGYASTSGRCEALGEDFALQDRPPVGE